MNVKQLRDRRADFPSFLEGLSLRRDRDRAPRILKLYFPSFLEGLSLRHVTVGLAGGDSTVISLPFWKGFH